MRITFFDILFLFLLLGGAALGFYRGFFRQAATTLVIYVSTVVATLTYRGLARLLSNAGTPNSATEMLSFILILGLLILLFLLMVSDLIGHIDISHMRIWVNFGGMLFGFINTALICAVILMIIRSGTSGGEWVGYEGIRLFFQRQTRGSWMAYLFRPFMQFVLTIIRPWLFGHDLPPLLINSL
ncbi:MAG: CvpA family protein [Anaerolineae bacterium]|nr:CvpA family protein [Anaerolineae bacterium]